MNQNDDTVRNAQSGHDDATAGPLVCADCRCEIDNGEGRPLTYSRYCHYCLMERLREGDLVRVEPVPAGESLSLALCQRCGGSGEVLLTAWQSQTQCFACWGEGFIVVETRSVRRVQRWSATFQTNKVNQVRGNRSLR